MRYNNDKSREYIFSRRAFILILIKSVIFLVIAVRLFFLQILRSNEYKTLSDRNRIKLLLLEPKRGKILDRNKIVLAENKVNYRLYFYKQRDHNFTTILDKVFEILGPPIDQKHWLYNTVRDANYIYPILLEEDLSWINVSKIEANLYKLPGVYINKGYARFYPFGGASSHVIGYMGPPTTEQAKDYKLFNNKEFKLGKSGLEKTFDDKLVGKFGNKRVEVNANRVVVRELTHEKSTAGQDQVTTLDAKLQEFVFNNISKEGAAVVVLDTSNGGVLSMISTPTFDPNLFSISISKQEWDGILKSKSYPLTNKVIKKLYPPGSPWKIVMALAILRYGIDPKKKIYCSGSLKVGNRVCKCVSTSGHGPVDLEKALAVSCNVYFYELAPIVGIENIHYIADILGFGHKTGIEISGEISGINPNKEWKKKLFSENWSVGDTINSSIGQGFIASTPIQLATMIARVATGKKISPTLIGGGSNIEDLNIDPAHLAIVHQGLASVFNAPYGTGYGSRIAEEEYAIAGKTGTAQVVAGDTVNSRIKSIKCHAIFTGYAPVINPKYAIVTIVDHAGWGSRAAAPLARDILYFAQKNLNI